VSDACEAFESGTGLLVLHECATLGAEGGQLGGYFLGEQRCDLIDAILFPSYRILALSLRSSNVRVPVISSTITKNFFWTYDEYLWVNEKVVDGE